MPFWFARRLEIDWLWIDSLCIIQDSEVDWAVQAANTCDIYPTSLITIAAEYGFLAESRRKMNVEEISLPLRVSARGFEVK
jgi:hypothetical protein